MKYIVSKKSWFWLPALLFIIVYSCSKMDDSYQNFTKTGEIRYSKNPDSINVFPGDERAEVWMAISEPNIVKCKVFWENGLDSVEIPVNKVEGNRDTVSAVINNLSEGAYTFHFYTYDSEGNISIGRDTVVYIYGKDYENSLINRMVSKSELSVDEGAFIDWAEEGDSSAVGTQLKFKDKNENQHLLFVPSDSMKTQLSVIPRGDTLLYRTAYLPVPNAIDTFYSPYETLVFTKPELIYDDFPETFESNAGDKTTYSQTNVQLTSGLWDFDYWLIGTAGADRKHGGVTSRSYGGQTSSGTQISALLEMLFDLPHGASKISFYYGICSGDDPSTFKVQASTDGGNTWFDVSPTLHNEKRELVYSEIKLDIEEPVRFRFYHFSHDEAGASQGRMNIDDISISYIYNP